MTSLAPLANHSPEALPFRAAFAAGRYRNPANAVAAAGRGVKMAAVVATLDAAGPLYLVVTPAQGQRAERAGFPVAYVPRAAH